MPLRPGEPDWPSSPEWLRWPPWLRSSGSLSGLRWPRAGAGLGLAALLAVPVATVARVPNTSEQGKSAAQVIAASEAAMKDVKSFHVVGAVGGKGTASTFSLSLSGTGGGGEISVPGATLDIVVAAGTVYIRAGEASWLKLTGSQSTAQAVADHWIKAPATNSNFANFADLTISTDFVAEFFPSAGTHLSETDGVVTVHSKKTIVLTDPQGDSLYVAALGPPYMLYIQGKNLQDLLTFSEFGDAPLPAVPKNAVTLPAS